jgi:hypothetical protein
MGSPLDLVNSEGFRKKLIVKNLPAYNKSPNRPNPPLNYEYKQSDLSVIDSPDNLIDDPIFSNKLYPLNQYGADGGYKSARDINILNNTKSNEGEYGFQDANIISQAEVESKKWKSINVYGNGAEALLDSAEFFNSLDSPRTGNPTLTNNQPYPSFNSSTYSPLSILLSQDPQGDNGLLSQDSFIARLGAQTLRKEFEQRIAVNIKKETIGRANIFNVRSGTDILEMATGRVPLIEPNWAITVPENILVRAADFSLKLSGAELAVSPIPGSYFDPNINPKQPTTIQQIGRTLFGKGNNFFNRLLGAGQTGSDLMYANMGGGQKSRLFGNINYNKYKPSFERTLFDRLAGALVGDTTNTANYYVGSTTSDPSRVFSPGGDLPVDVFGKEVQSPVYGPHELAQLYEGPSQSIKLGANGPIYSNGGGIEGGMTWVSPKYKENAGRRVGPGGQTTGDIDDDFRLSSSYSSTESTNQEFRSGSILDQTQKLINSQPNGGRRLQHVGNAIDQVSKVFHDGYKEITKGSKVLTYEGEIGQEVGTEYCRIFTKDLPYLQYNDLQKTDGIVDEGRKFSWSVLNKTYNLNIAPNKREGDQDSSNLIGNSSSDNSYAKKYMFSLENLSWRTSNTPGFTVADLPVCERGPNGGRVMWFPPYDLKFTESVSANWKGQDFLGRPEPVYTYTNTSRSGTLNWKIVVDHPSVLNIIVNKVLNNETNKSRIDSMLESFFAGCLKYDLYDLAKKYYNVKPDDLKVMQKVITDKMVTDTQINYIKQTIQTGNDSNTNQPIKYTPVPNVFKEYEQTAFYFENNLPRPGGNSDFKTLVENYFSPANVQSYKTLSPDTSGQTTSFFSSTVESNYNRINELINKIDEQLKKYNNGNIIINLMASASAPASESYNLSLSQRRLASAKNYIINSKLKTWVDQGRLIIKEKAVGEISRSEPLQKNPQTGSYSVPQTFNCSSSNPDAQGGDVTVQSKEVFTIGAMACRRTYIDSITSTLQEPVTPPPPTNREILVGNVVTSSKRVPVIEEKFTDRNNITKYVLRQLLTECDYFEAIKEDSPMVYDNLKEKLKFFQPAFHSITPEGLNSRLTFLQQCLRPGDTIPVVKEVDGTTTLQYNNATNTAFGSPPVLVLRVGDFYHTKIIPTSLGITYEDTLDLNPEGIGVQPMIANISLQFNFVGGHGLKTSIDKLQNALTFNYYANTEIYDDRADATDDSWVVLDKEFLAKEEEPAPPTINQADPAPGQTNGNTIGVVMTKEINEYETGTINYSDFMVGLKDATQTYFQTVFNKTKETVYQYNNAVRQIWMSERNYTKGTIYAADTSTLDNAFIFGKPNQKNIADRFDILTRKLEDEINNDIEGFIAFMSQPSLNFSSRSIKQIKRNYINYIKTKSSFYENSLTKITQDLVLQEQAFIKILGKANTVVFKGDPSIEDGGTDGFEQNNGTVVVYNTSGTTNVNPSSSGATNTYEELYNDFSKIRVDMIEFKTQSELSTNFTYSVDKKEYDGKLIYEVTPDGLPDFFLSIVEDVFIPFSKKDEFASNTFRRVYMLVSDDITDDKKYNNFKEQLIGNVRNNKIMINNGRDNFDEAFDAYWKKIVLPLFNEENNITKEFIDYVEKTNLKDYLNYTPFDKKERVFTFTTYPSNKEPERESQNKLIKGLGASKNPSSNFRTWNDPVGEGTAFSSKINLR